MKLLNGILFTVIPIKFNNVTWILLSKEIGNLTSHPREDHSLVQVTLIFVCTHFLNFHVKDLSNVCYPWKDSKWNMVFFYFKHIYLLMHMYVCMYIPKCIDINTGMPINLHTWVDVKMCISMWCISWEHGFPNKT